MRVLLTKLVKESTVLKKSYILCHLPLLFLFLTYVVLISSQACASSSCSTCNSSDPNICMNCSSNLVLTNSTCCSSIITKCGQCISSPDICDNCLSNSYCLISNTTCQLCSVNISSCQTCSRCDTCITCKIDYFLNSSTLCYKCSDFLINCKTCDSISNCLTCSKNIYGVNSTQQCELCTQLINHCQTCLNFTNCTKCINNNYAINGIHLCQPCHELLQFCTNCTSSSTCIKCVDDLNIILIKNKYCDYCSTVIPFCLNCTTVYTCILCANYYSLMPTLAGVYCIACFKIMAKCLQCTSMVDCTSCLQGNLVKHGCSTVPGCIEVQQIAQGVSICKYCNSSEYEYIPVDGNCVCLKGHLAGKYCTQIMGCTSVNRTDISEVCKTCDTKNSFTIQGTKCKCQQYYELSNSTCKQICGDGHVIVLPCDDGNLIDGDGCSSVCRVEQRYSCKKRVDGQSSICVYRGTVKLVYTCMYKMDNNIVNIVLQTDPQIKNFQQSNLTNLIIINSSASCEVNGYTIQGSTLNLQILYHEDIDDKYIIIEIAFDPNYIRSQNSIVQTTFKDCQGKSLKYINAIEHQSDKLYWAIFSKPLTIITLINFFIGSVSEKMIGVQMVHTLQIFLILQVYFNDYDISFNYLKQMYNVIGFYQNGINLQNQSDKVSIQNLDKLNFTMSFQQGVLLQTIFHLISIFIYLLFFIFQKNQKIIEEKTQTNFTKQDFIKYKNTVYQHMIFPIFVGFYFGYDISKLLLLKRSSLKPNESYDLDCIICIFSTMILSFIFFHEWKLNQSQKSSQNLRYKQNYIKIYLLKTFVFVCLLQLKLFDIFSISLQVMVSIELLYTISLIFFRPYYSLLNNIVIYLHQIGVLSSYILVILQRLVLFKQSFYKILLYSFVAYCTLINILAIIRSVIQVRRRWNSRTIRYENEQKQMQALLNQKKYEVEMETRYLQKYYRQQKELLIQMENKYISNTLTQAKYAINGPSANFCVNRFTKLAYSQSPYIIKRKKRAQICKNVLKYPLKDSGSQIQ